jgi:cell division protein FtsI/penicillin-binding protein 2
MMTTFGLGVAVTPLEMAALVSAIANGGTLYYVQYPHTKQEIEQFKPRVKRELDIRALLPAVKDGMLAAVELGTGRRANNGPDDPVFGKTGTCTDARSATHLGWFASFNRGGRRSVAVVVLLTGGRPVNGNLAASIAGAVYKTLRQDDYCGQVPLTAALQRLN